MSEIKTPEDWWLLLEEHKNQLIDLVGAFHPHASIGITDQWLKDELMSITAPGAEAIRQAHLKELENQPKEQPVAAFELATEGRSDWQKAHEILNTTWWGIPESDAAHGLPAFYALCDLRSEFWVFEQPDIGEEPDAAVHNG